MDKLKDTVEKKKFVFISQSFVSDLSMHMGKESWRQSKGNAKIYSCRGWGTMLQLQRQMWSAHAAIATSQNILHGLDGRAHSGYPYARSFVSTWEMYNWNLLQKIYHANNRNMTSTATK
jgi:hypothetical protein